VISDYRGAAQPTAEEVITASELSAEYGIHSQSQREQRLLEILNLLKGSYEDAVKRAKQADDAKQSVCSVSVQS
jgi:hypothetical protein